MTIRNPEISSLPNSQTTEAWLPEEEIDLRKYVFALAAWWREIILIAMLTAVMAAGYVLLTRFLSSPQYLASSSVAIIRTQSNINFDERFQTTVAQEDVTSNLRVIDYASRRAALLGLVVSGSVAQAVIDQLGDVLTEEDERMPAYWLSGDRVLAELLIREGSRNESDLIKISVQAGSAEKAAAVATAWAENYVAQINKLYGEVPVELVTSVEMELVQSQNSYDQSQQALEEFIAQNEIDRLNRQITEKREIIQSLQAGRQTAITTLVEQQLTAQRQIISAFIEAQTRNRLLAFNREQEAKRGIISALMDADSANRLRAFEADQQARRRLFDQYVAAQTENQLLALEKEQSGRAALFASYVKAEIDNRLVAFQQEQNARSTLFSAYASADSRSKVAVFNQQVEAKLQTLASYYDRKQRYERLLSEAQGLWLQVSLGGQASVSTNHLALVLLKAQVFATSAPLPGELQLRLDELNVGDITAADQAKDVDALISVLRSRLAEVDRLILLQSRLVFNNEGYDLLDAQRPEADPLYESLQQKYAELFDLGDLAQRADQVQTSELSQAILVKYNELFTVGPLAEAGQKLQADTDLNQSIQAKYEELFGVGAVAQSTTVFSATTPLLTSIEAAYPSLFMIGSLSNLTEEATGDTPLGALSESLSRELLQLQGLEDVPAYTASAEPLLQAIDNLEKEIQALEARREGQTARQGQLIRQRDVALSTLNTLRNKSAELNLARTVTNREVRFASPAVEPLRPLPRMRLITTAGMAGIIGLFLAVCIAFFANFLGMQPWLSRLSLGSLGR